MLRSAGVKDTVAKQVADTYLAAADSRTRLTIVKNALKSHAMNQVLGAMVEHAVPADVQASVLDAINARVDELLGGSAAGHAGQFGTDQYGADVSRVYNNLDDTEAKSRAAALELEDAGKFHIPTSRALKQFGADVAQMQRWTAKNAVLTKGLPFEQWIDHNINEKLFQPLALATAGWATRVSASEAMLNVLREGPLNFTASRIAASAAKQNLKLATEEMPHFVAAVRGVLAGMDEGVVKSLGKEKILDAATALMKLHDGHIIHPALDATHAPPLRGTDEPSLAEADVRAMNRRGGKIRNLPLSDHYTILAPGDNGYFRSWSEMAGRMSQGRVGSVAVEAYKGGLDAGLSERDASALAVRQVKNFLDSLPERDVAMMDRHYAMSREGTDNGLTPHEDWAVQEVRALKGLVYGADGTFHKAMLNDMADKLVPDMKTLMQTHAGADLGSLPMNIPGREVDLKVSGIVQRASNTLHSKILGPIVNALVPRTDLRRRLRPRARHPRPAVKAGRMTQDQADVIAQTRAAFDSIRFVHNPIDRLKVENMLHVVAPFYFAQNQALRRAGRLFAQNPGAFEQLLKIYMGLNNVATQVTAANGIPEVVVPGSTISGEGVSSAPLRPRDHRHGLHPDRSRHSR